MKQSRLCSELVAIFAEAYPCRHLCSACSQIRYDPIHGHIPRGYCGGFGRLEDIELVLILAEPGNPPPGQETYDKKSEPDAYVLDIANGVFGAIKSGDSAFHRNIASILNECWPQHTIEEQLKRTWITESVLCSAKIACAKIPRVSEQACGVQYLKKQLDLLSGRFVATLGRKAAQRIARLEIEPNFEAAAPGLPGGNTQKSRLSWKRLGKAFQKHRCQ